MPDAIAASRALVDEAWTTPAKWQANLSSAESLLRVAQAEKPDDPQTLTCLGTVLCDQGRHKDAVELLAKAVRLGSTDRNTFFNLGVALLNCAKHEDAKTFFSRAGELAASPLSWEAYFDAQAQ